MVAGGGAGYGGNKREMNQDTCNLGMGVMIGLLSGNESSVKAFQSCVGKTIKSLSLSDDVLHFVMDDGTKMDMYDDGQSCCESRYMTTDDKLEDFIGAKLIGAEVKEADPIACPEDEVHEIAFLDVTTDKGVFQMKTHNEHNGYYGGFLIRAVTV